MGPHEVASVVTPSHALLNRQLDPRAFVTLEGAATHCGVQVQAIRRMIKRGRLRACVSPVGVRLVPIVALYELFGIPPPDDPTG